MVEPRFKRPDDKLSIPFALIDRTEADEVAKVAGDPVAIYRSPPALRNVQ